MVRRWMLVAPLLVAMFLVGAVPAATAQSGVNARIRLTGSQAFPAATGTAKYLERGGEREFEVEVEHVRRLVGQTLTVFVDGTQAGTMRVNRFGAARLDLNTEFGQVVPMVKSGSSVLVKTAAGVLVVSGKFA